MLKLIEEVNVIIDSPLMYIVVGVVLTFFTEWRISRAIRRIMRSPEVKELIKEVVKKMMEGDQKS